MKQSFDMTLAQLQHWFQAPQSELEPLFKQARQITDEVLGHRISLFTPGNRFPAISITGSLCKLNCQHCGGRYLRHMKSLTQPDQLVSFCQNLAAHQGLGCLVSGGCDAHGCVPLLSFLPALREIKQSTSLYINTHTGFLTNNDARQLADTDIDCASVDVVGDNDTIHKVYGLTGRTTHDYRTTLQALKLNNIAVSPHICVGLHFGKLAGELNALKIIQETIDPSVIVIIALVPSQKTAMERTLPPSNYDIARICAIARVMFPKTEIALGCMRPRGKVRREMEQLAIKAGVTRIAVPTQTTLKYLKDKSYKITVNHTCCVV